MRWGDADAQRNVREAGGWIGALGAPVEREPDMSGAFIAFRDHTRFDTRDHDNFDCAREDERLGFAVTSEDAPGLHGPTTGFQSVAEARPSLRGPGVPRGTCAPGYTPDSAGADSSPGSCASGLSSDSEAVAPGSRDGS